MAEACLPPAGGDAPGLADGPTVIFSDVDGTLVHYLPKDACISAEPDADGRHWLTEGQRKIQILQLPVSSTGKVGVISTGTLEKFARLRDGGHHTIIISGARTSTILQRLGWLPEADAYITENGGRIFWADKSRKTAVPIREDINWRRTHDSACGPSSAEAVSPSERAGPLWDLYRKFESGGWQPDASSYQTAFRVRPRPPTTTAEALADIIRDLPEGIDCSFNLGSADFYPSTSGKARAAEYVMSVLGASPAGCALLCDDDNDLALAATVGAAYLPSVATQGVAAAAAADPEKFTVSSERLGPFGSEDVLDALLAALAKRATPKR